MLGCVFLPVPLWPQQTEVYTFTIQGSLILARQYAKVGKVKETERVLLDVQKQLNLLGVDDEEKYNQMATQYELLIESVSRLNEFATSTSIVHKLIENLAAIGPITATAINMSILSLLNSNNLRGAMERRVEFVEFGGQLNAETFHIMMRYYYKKGTRNAVLMEMDKALQYGVADSECYEMAFQQYVVVQRDENKSYEELGKLTLALYHKNLRLQPEALRAALRALKAHKMYHECIRLFLKEFQRGNIVFDVDLIHMGFESIILEGSVEHYDAMFYIFEQMKATAIDAFQVSKGVMPAEKVNGYYLAMAPTQKTFEMVLPLSVDVTSYLEMQAEPFCYVPSYKLRQLFEALS